MKLEAQTPTEVLAKVLWWMIHSESVSMLSCEADSRFSFSCRVATEKDDILASSHLLASLHHMRDTGARDLRWASNREKSAARLDDGCRVELYSRSWRGPASREVQPAARGVGTGLPAPPQETLERPGLPARRWPARLVWSTRSLRWRKEATRWFRPTIPRTLSAPAPSEPTER